MKSTTSTFSARLAEYFFKLGCSKVFAITGAGSIRLIEEFQEYGFDCTYFHHEQAALMAAIGYAKLTGTPGVCIVTGGPGAINAVTGMASAYLDSVPLFVLAGQEKSNFYRDHVNLRAYGVQGLDMCAITEKVSKKSLAISNAASQIGQIKQCIALAASGRMGPIWLDIPQDVQWQHCDEIRFEETKESSAGSEEEVNAAIDEIVRLLASATRPLLWIGNGVRLSKSIAECRQLVEHLKVPCLVSWQAADIITTESDYYLGRAGTYGQRYANIALQKSDLVIAIGTRLAIPQRGYDDAQFAPRANIFVVDIDASELAKLKFENFTTIATDAGNFIRNLHCATQLFERDSASWKSEIANLKKLFPMLGPGNLSSGKVDVYNLIAQLSSVLIDDQIIVTDMGSALTVTHSTIELRANQRLLTSTGLGEMGFGLPAVTGCCIAEMSRSRPLLIVGEGSLMMNIQELQTIRDLRVKPKIILINNSSYLTIQHTHKALYGEKRPPTATNASTGVKFPSFQEVFAAFGLSYTKIDENGQVRDALSRFMESDTDVIEFRCKEFQELIPKSAVKVSDDGQIFSPPLEDMYPFIGDERLQELMR